MRKKGFTFIEILVSVTIIAILMAVGVVSYTSVNKRSRDARRISDLEQLRSALEMYKADLGFYPDVGAGSTTVVSDLTVDLVGTGETAGYLTSIPDDPKYDATSYDFHYQIKMKNEVNDYYHSYCLYAKLETVDSQLDSYCEDVPTEDYNFSLRNP